ncbi:hypothetical protein [Aeromonas sp. QDB11]|uniref:hypothetical protein n=1 Tax=Aeromonas sp. QDB11 TaxID=2990482 RepID=UPI0022DF16DC|nr:hypothetical protein [Aeromonas sp. QDB11]
MESSDVLLLAALGIGAYVWFNNKTKTKDVTTIRESHTVKTNTGQVTYERVRETDSRSLDWKSEGVDRFMAPSKVQQPPTPVSTQQAITVSVSHRKSIPSTSTTHAAGNNLTTTYQDVTPNGATIDAVKVTGIASKGKVCQKCKKPLSNSHFRPNPNSEDGLTKWCSSCMELSHSDDRHHKTCPHCHKRRLKTNFDKNSNQPDGLTKWCRYCMAASKK